MINNELIVPDFNSYEDRVLVMKTISIIKTKWEE